MEVMAYLPPPIPDRLNFFKAPIMKDLLYPGGNAPSATFAALRKKFVYLQGNRVLGNIGAGQTADFSALRNELEKRGLTADSKGAQPAAGVVAALEPLRGMILDLRAAAAQRPLEANSIVSPEQRLAALRPGSPQPPDLSLDSVFFLGWALALRAQAELAIGDIDDASADTIMTLRLARGNMSPPATVLGVLVGNALLGLAAQPIWQGCANHQWNAAQLVHFQDLMETLNPVADYDRSVRLRRAATSYFLMQMPGRDIRTFYRPQDMGVPRWPWALRGWREQNVIRSWNAFEKDVIGCLDPAAGCVRPSRAEEGARQLALIARSSSPYDALLRVSYQRPSIPINFAMGTAQSENIREEAITGCALERFRLARGAYPDTLDALTGKYLPHPTHDVIDGRPLRYLLDADGSFKLYSIGWNERDDGGVPDPKGSPASGDWVWFSKVMR